MSALPDQIAAARRELAMRHRVYPAWVSKGRMTQAKADAEIAAMESIVETLAMFSPAPPQAPVDYIDRFGSRCRDCADEDGVCPASGLPCGGSDKAIRHVLTAIIYGLAHGYLPAAKETAP